MIFSSSETLSNNLFCIDNLNITLDEHINIDISINDVELLFACKKHAYSLLCGNINPLFKRNVS
jgi:hypothetical protein